tara:strand:+ start:706 stop:1173 length:468 start_codon:yes stop_codon:yes gene_type:complete
MSQVLTEVMNVRVGLAPLADVQDTDPTTDWFDMRVYRRIVFAYVKGVGATGTATITVSGASDNAGTGSADIAYKYRNHANAAAQGALTSVAATGFTVTAGSNETTLVEVDAADLPDGKPWCSLTLTEVVDSPVLGTVIAIMTEPRYPQAILDAGV